AGSAWDIKLLRGGIVDCEFIAQYLQLRHAHTHPEVLSGNTTEALARLRDAGVLDANTADQLIAAMSLWRNLQGALRLGVGPAFDQSSAQDGAKAMLATACGMEDFAALERTVAERLRICRDIF